MAPWTTTSNALPLGRWNNSILPAEGAPGPGASFGRRLPLQAHRHPVDQPRRVRGRPSLPREVEEVFDDRIKRVHFELERIPPEPLEKVERLLEVTKQALGEGMPLLTPAASTAGLGRHSCIRRLAGQATPFVYFSAPARTRGVLSDLPGLLRHVGGGWGHGSARSTIKWAPRHRGWRWVHDGRRYLTVGHPHPVSS
jgi:hypothetical protein